MEFRHYYMCNVRNVVQRNFTSVFADVGALLQGCGLAAGYQPRPQVVDRGTTARYGGQLRYI